MQPAACMHAYMYASGCNVWTVLYLRNKLIMMLACSEKKGSPKNSGALTTHTHTPASKPANPAQLSQPDRVLASCARGAAQTRQINYCISNSACVLAAAAAHALHLVDKLSKFRPGGATGDARPTGPQERRSILGAQSLSVVNVIQEPWLRSMYTRNKKSMEIIVVVKCVVYECMNVYAM